MTTRARAQGPDDAGPALSGTREGGRGLAPRLDTTRTSESRPKRPQSKQALAGGLRGAVADRAAVPGGAPGELAPEVRAGLLTAARAKPWDGAGLTPEELADLRSKAFGRRSKDLHQQWRKRADGRGPTRTRKPAGDLPGYVQACQDRKWHLRISTFNKATGLVLSTFHAPYRCRSWRHPGECRRWRASQNFARVHAALSQAPKDALTFLVLTLDQKEWATRYEAFTELRERWRSLAKAIRRKFGEFAYVSTVEAHRSGWPHMNVIVVNRRLAELAQNRSQARDWLVPHALGCGFGHQCFIEQADDGERLAGYVVKLAGDIESAPQENEQGQLVGEVVKLSQVPELAPKGFRRLRSSVRFLPPPFKRDGVTGELVTRPLPNEAPLKECELLKPRLEEVRRQRLAFEDLQTPEERETLRALWTEYEAITAPVDFSREVSGGVLPGQEDRHREIVERIRAAEAPARARLADALRELEETEWTSDAAVNGAGASSGDKRARADVREPGAATATAGAESRPPPGVSAAGDVFAWHRGRVALASGAAPPVEKEGLRSRGAPGAPAAVG